MAHTINEIFVDAARLDRIRNHPFLIYPTDGNAKSFIIDDNLEMGSLTVYENIGKVFSLQKFAADPDEQANIVLVADIVISALWRQETVMIHSIGCKYEYEYLINSMIGQVAHFASFYECYRTIWISEREWEKWLRHDRIILSKFRKKGSSYVYQIR